MKSSTLRRSNLSKERMAMLEELAKNRQKPYDASPGVYVRASKEKELDVLWQNFRVSQKEDKSPGIYLATGFIVGAVAMLIMTTLLSFSVRRDDTQDIKPPKRMKAEKARLTFIPSDKNNETATSTKNETYTVKDGDTLESIIVQFYGKFDPSKVEKIRVANKMVNPNKLQIGQNLIVPLD
ncbi:MAG TPA: LysM domain-containing protein [Candidatus Gastranaerophilaceae bacterium]|nr:LysM domain-containing protein [Candidatus Gastranaerophilaceae bacterium]HPT41665.1 LysM domain-containing protein [Candidatus Gastranaerophilaceae bacterium]